MQEFSNSSIVDKWNAAKGDIILRLEDPLNKDSVVFDVGAYKGSWSDAIYRQYEPNIYLFEPVKEQSTLLLSKYKNSPRIKVFSFGLAGEDKEAYIHYEGKNKDSASAYGANKIGEKIYMRSFDTVLKDLGIEKVDLMKINIEGLEYELMESIIRHGLLKRVIHYQIQFHSFVDDSVRRRDAIQKELSLHYDLSYDFPFVWEGWSLKKKTEI